MILTVDEWERQSCRIGRDHGPRLLSEWSHQMPLPVLRYAVLDAWIMHDHPVFPAVGGLYPWVWERYFRSIGFTVDGEPTDRPEGRVTLYRGAHPFHRRGYSWTTDPEQAQWFARTSSRRGLDGLVYRMSAPWTSVWAVVNHVRTGLDRSEAEAEVICDPYRLRIALLETATTVGGWLSSTRAGGWRTGRRSWATWTPGWRSRRPTAGGTSTTGRAPKWWSTARSSGASR
jgi:hypothetical protein